MGIVEVAAMRLGNNCSANCDQDGHAAINQIGSQCRQAIVTAVRPAIFDPHALAVGEPGFLETFEERSHSHIPFARRGGEIADHRQRARLCSRCAWQQDRHRRGEPLDEIAPTDHEPTSS
jgi:hypothetical protein